jgi:SAM-dependent methyltransferase
MMGRKGEALAAQTQYYIRTGAQYDEQQVHPMDEHANALGWLATLIDQRQYRSVLDIGSGTGRELLYLKGRPRLLLRGIEPSQTLRESGVFYMSTRPSGPNLCSSAKAVAIIATHMPENQSV